MAKKIEKESNKLEIFKKLLFLFVLLQPILDVLSNLYNNGFYSFNFVTYLKPLFVFGMYLYLFTFIKYKGKLKQFLYYLLIVIFILCHTFLLYYICVEPSVIFHEIRFTINIVYFITLSVIFITLGNIIEDKKIFYNEFKKVLMLTIGLYIFLYLFAVVTNTSWLTYEFADANKLGFRGWYFNGQIFGHILSIGLPLMIYWISNLKIKSFYKIVLLLLLISPFYLIGTKVTIYILILVNVINILIYMGYKVVHHTYKINYLALIFSIIVIIGTICSFKILPVYHNIYLNNMAKGGDSQKENVNEYSDKITDKKNANKNKEENNEPIVEKEERRLNAEIIYDEWTLNSMIKLNELYEKGVLHSADNRSRQLYFNYYMFKQATWPFKILGIGYVNQTNQLALERDIVMPLFSFGIIGFILFTGLIWAIFFKIIKYFIKNLKKIDIETVLYVEVLCMFICISYEAGYTFIYTQFSMILAVIIGLLNLKLNINEKNKN